MPKSLRFLIFLIPCTLLRFYLGENSFSFLWFLVLYFPFINWSTYWIMLVIRSGLNLLQDGERISIEKTKSIFVWYLNLPGALAISDVIYSGYLFNR
jgi:hypothetical protein